jgi:hypothetical protein
MIGSLSSAITLCSLLPTRLEIGGTGGPLTMSAAVGKRSTQRR